MKRILALLLALMTLVSLVACGGNKNGSDGTGDTTAATDNGIPEEFDLVSTADATFDYFHSDLTPYLNLTDELLSSLTVDLDVTPEEVDDYINEVLLPNYRTPIKVTNRAVKNGDVVYIYYTGYIDDVAFDGGSNADNSEPYALTIGSGEFIPGFEDNLIDVFPDQATKESPYPVIATFPEGYGNADLAGKEARFDVEIVGILDGYEIPELTADFVLNVLEYETDAEGDAAVDAFKAELYSEMRDYRVEKLDTFKLSKVIEALSVDTVMTGAYPEGEVDRNDAALLEEVQYYYTYYNTMSYMYYGVTYFDSEDDAGTWYFGLGDGADWRTYMHGEAERIVRQDMILCRVAQLYGITFTEDDAKEWVRTCAVDHDATVADVLDHYSIEEIYVQMAYEKARPILLSLVTYTYGELKIPEQ